MLTWGRCILFPAVVWAGCGGVKAELHRPNPNPNPNPSPNPSPNQFTSTLDLLEDFLTHKEYKYCRLDGSTNRVQRTVDINSFNMPGSSKVRLRLRRRRT